MKSKSYWVKKYNKITNESLYPEVELLWDTFDKIKITKR